MTTNDNNNTNFTQEYIRKREKYLTLDVDGNCNWMTKLRYILNSDIHEKPLGCKISNTHMRIGKVHLDTFFEAQILFSHARWVKRFAIALGQSILATNQNIKSDSKPKKIVLVGYETYIEPVLYYLKKHIKEEYYKKNQKQLPVEYCIFEEKKYIYHQTEKGPEIRYIETAFNKQDTIETCEQTQIIFVCGISSTLNTFGRMKKQLREDLKTKVYREENDGRINELPLNNNGQNGENVAAGNKLLNFSIIQVLPNSQEDELAENGWPQFIIAGKKNEKGEKGEQHEKYSICWDEKEKLVTMKSCEKKDDGWEENEITVPYIVDVKCGWKKAVDCELCYPDDVSEEKPIIETSETSVVPIQQISLNGSREKKDGGKGGKKKAKNSNGEDDEEEPLPSQGFGGAIDFFARDKDGKFIFQDYLYRGHIVRGEHHFAYYIRTNHLFADIISGKISIGRKNALKFFTNYCTAARKNIVKRSRCKMDEAVHIIVSPAHFSSKMFCNAINDHVFESKAHIISFDPQKEYRSNFETKYSNYAYFFEQNKENGPDNSDKPKNLFFYFVDDQIITGASFYRMTSLIKNLIPSLQYNNVNVKIWQGVFVVSSRNSKKTKRDYVEDPHAYYPLFDFAVASVRSYADSCPMCKMRADAENNVKKSILDCNAQRWMDKVSVHATVTLNDAKKNYQSKTEDEKEQLKSRHIRRFYCENELNKCLNEPDGQDIHSTLVKAVRKILDDSHKQQCEFLISCVKALSRPFIYYREDVKPAALKILIGITEGLIKNQEVVSNNFAWGTTPLCLYPTEKLVEVNDDTAEPFAAGNKKSSNEKEKISVVFNNKEEVYNILEILINCLASIDSTYLLHFNNDGTSIIEICKIAELYTFVANLYGDNAKATVLTFSPRDGQNNQAGSSFYNVLLNSIKRIILGISGEAKSAHLEASLAQAEANPVVQKFVHKKKKNSIYEFTLVQAIFLENSVVGLQLKDEKENELNVTKKYRSIIKKLKKHADNESMNKNENEKENASESDSEEDSKEIKLQFLYHDRMLNSKVEGNKNSDDFEVFIMDDSAECKSLLEILDEDPEDKLDISTVKKNLAKIGFYRYNNKFVIKLHEYQEKDIVEQKEESYKRKNKNSEKNGGDGETDLYEVGFNEVYLLVDFSKSDYSGQTSLKKQLIYIRKIMQYRYALAETIRADIDKGAIKAAIQAEGSKTFLNSRRMSSHGGVPDWKTLLNLSHNDIIKDDIETRKQGYETLKVLMNEIISMGAACETYSKYFEEGEFKDSGLFGVKTEWQDSYKMNLVAQYFKDRTENQNMFSDTATSDSDKRTEPSVKFNIDYSQYQGNKDEQFNVYPKLFDSDCVIGKGNSAYQVCLIGLIDVFVHNAIIHSVENNAGENEAVSIGVKIEGTPDSYSITISNAYMEKEPDGEERPLVQPKMLHRTSQFTIKYVKFLYKQYKKALDKRPNRSCFFVTMQKKDEKYIATIYVNKKENE